MTYEYFKNKLNSIVTIDEDFLFELLCNVIENYRRYTGCFRLTNSKTKLIQNVTQSMEIKFGDFLEDIITTYITEMGFQNLNKNIGTDMEGNPLSADQIFCWKDKCNKHHICLIEQKIRDDHDSTKKRGQYLNFKKKYELLKNTYGDYEIHAIMWFIDGSLAKNRKFYTEEIFKEQEKQDKTIDIRIYYGNELFSNLCFDRIDIWEELVKYLCINKQERSQEVLTIPNFDTDQQILNVLLKLKREKPLLYQNLLMSNNEKYKAIREELFPTGYNLRLSSKY